MNHLDEGTIHAWLDGALDNPQSGEVESHVATCAECRERVAEARGLIAGASRILGALDDVPGGVLPAGSRAAPTPPTVPAPRVAPRRWATPWVTGIAALLVAAVVLRTSDSVRDSESAADLSARAAMDTVREIIESSSPVANAAAAPAEVGAPSAPAPMSAQGGEAPPRRALAELEASRDRERRVSSAPATRSATAGSVAGGAGAAGTPAREERLGFAAEAAPPAAPSPTPAPPAAPPPVAADMAQKAAAEAVTVTAAQPPALTVENALSGCYVVSFGGERVADAVAEASLGRAASRTARPQMGAAAPAAVAPSAAARADIVGATLLSLSLAPTDSARVFIVRDARTDSVVGTWRALDSASAEIRSAGGQRVVVPRTIRTRCP